MSLIWLLLRVPNFGKFTHPLLFGLTAGVAAHGSLKALRLLRKEETTLPGCLGLMLTIPVLALIIYVLYSLSSG